MKLRCGVIGCGVIGLRHIGAYKRLSDAVIAGACDPREEARANVAEHFGCATYASFPEMLATENLDAVSICTPESEHVLPAVAAARQGIHVLVEKPLADTLEGARAIADAAQIGGVVCMPCYILRFDPRYALARQAVASGAIGEPIHAVARINAPANYYRLRTGARTDVILAQTIHDIDLLRWFLGKEVVRVQAAAATVRQPDVADTVVALLHFEGGEIAVLENSWGLANGLAHDAGLRVVGTDGTVTVDTSDPGLTISRPSGTEWPDTIQYPTLHGEVAGAVFEMVSHFVSCLRDGRSPLVSVEDGIVSLRIALAIRRACTTGELIGV